MMRTRAGANATSQAHLEPNGFHMDGDDDDDEDEEAHEPLKFTNVDHYIELHGHIIGMCLSPDHR